MPLLRGTAMVVPQWQHWPGCREQVALGCRSMPGARSQVATASPHPEQ